MIKSLTQIPNTEKEDPVNRDYSTKVPVDEMKLRKCSFGAGMKECTLNQTRAFAQR